MSNVAEIIEQLRERARVAAGIDADLDKLHGINREIGIRHGDPKATARTYAINSAEVELEKYLNSLDTETLRRVGAVMYSGRGEGPAVDVRTDLVETHSSKDNIVRAIIEKRVSFDPYFERGLARAKADGIDLDTF